MFTKIETQRVLDQVETTLGFEGMEFTKSGYVREDAKSYLIYRLDDLKTKIHGTEVTPTIRIINANDGATAFRIMVGCFRWVCMNGLSAGDMFYSQRIVHRAGQTFDDKLREIPYKIAASVDYLATEFANDIQKLDNLMTEEETINLIGNLRIPKKAKRKAIYHMYRPRRQEDVFGRLNIWGLWNNVNESLRETCNGENAVGMNDKLLTDIKLLSA